MQESVIQAIKPSILKILIFLLLFIKSLKSTLLPALFNPGVCRTPWKRWSDGGTATWTNSCWENGKWRELG